MKLLNKKVLSFIHHDFEDLELLYPYYRLLEEGATVTMAGEVANETYIGKYGVPHISDISFADVKAEEYDALLVPGGWAPDKLRRFKEVIDITKHMHEGWVLISAKILQGVKCTSTPGIKDDMENAGAIWLNEPAVADGHIISAQRPPDLPAYMRLFVECLAKK
jgi:protease I